MGGGGFHCGAAWVGGGGCHDAAAAAAGAGAGAPYGAGGGWDAGITHEVCCWTCADGTRLMEYVFAGCAPYPLLVVAGADVCGSDGMEDEAHGSAAASGVGAGAP
jgi:hypothetical protein